MVTLRQSRLFMLILIIGRLRQQQEALRKILVCLDMHWQLAANHAMMCSARDWLYAVEHA